MSNGENIRTVITYGTFDLFHIGHLRLLQHLKTLGDHVIVGVSTDDFNSKKGKRCIVPYAHRSEIVANIKGVDRVIAEHSWAQKKHDIRNYSVDVFAIGDDWEGQFDHLGSACEVIYIPRTFGVSSTNLKQAAANFNSSDPKKISEAFELMQCIAKDLS